MPEVLTDGQEPEVPTHQGTGDVDLHMEVEVDTKGKSLADLEGALARAGFQPDPKAVGGWQWVVTIDGFRVRVDLLCDSSEAETETVFKITERLGVMNLRGTRYVTDDFAIRRLTGRLQSGAEGVVEARFAGLAGYLLTKCVSAVSRQKDKDFYDLVYVLVYNRAGGPEAAARAIIDVDKLARHIPTLTNTLRELRERYLSLDSIGTVAFVKTHELASPGGDSAQLGQDAIVAVERFVVLLLESGGRH